MTRLQWIGSAVTFALAGLLLFYSKQISENIVELFIPKIESTLSQPPLANIASQEGGVFVRRTGTADFIFAKQNTQILHQDQIKTERLSSTRIHFESGWVIELKENSLISLEFYRPESSTSPVLVTFIRGKYRLMEAGTAGLLFITQNRKTSAPKSSGENILTQQNAELPNSTLQNLAKPNANNVSSNVKSTIQSPPILQTQKMPEKISDAQKKQNDETLSNDYIQKILSAQTASLQHCQLNSIKDHSKSEGLLLISLTISQNGRVSKTQVLQNESNNPDLASCVSSVISRLQFKSFTGLAISLTYPIHFK